MRPYVLILVTVLPLAGILAFAFSDGHGEGTTPGKVEKIQNNETDPSSWAKVQLQHLSLEEKIAQFFMVSVYPDQSEEQFEATKKLVHDSKVGGIILFQGDKKSCKKAIQSLNEISETPLLVGMDAEWGTNMRLFDGERFPYAYTLGAANDTACTANIARLMAQECRNLGIHVSFSPVSDVNADPKNPVIGYRSFGQNPTKVAEHVSAFVRATEKEGILSCLKHFPGHGDTDKDSHLELPSVSRSITELEKSDFVPFKLGISAGVGSVMVAHLNVPAIDAENTPSSLSQKVIKDLLIGQLKFNGLVFSDALNMKAVSETYGKDEVAVKAFTAGCDILLCPEDVTGSIKKIAEKVRKGELSEKEIDTRCLKVLEHKFRYVIKAPKTSLASESELEYSKQIVFDKALTVLKNNSALPFETLDKTIECRSIGMHTGYFRDALSLFDDVPYRHYFTLREAIENEKTEKAQPDILIYALHASTLRQKSNFGLGLSVESLSHLPKGKKTVLVLFGNPLYLNGDQVLKQFDAVVVGYENSRYAQKSAAQLLYGAMDARGMLPVSVNEQLPESYGIHVPWGGRLKFSYPEEIGVASKRLNGIDSIVHEALEKKAFPGCQIVVAVKGKIVYRKSFGKPTYDSNDSVTDTDLYDLASVSKIAGSTAGVMHLQTNGKFSLDKQLGEYLPELTSGTAYSKILLRDMMAHQAGLTAWIPFYKKTLKEDRPDPSIYSSVNNPGRTLKVANELFIKKTYVDSIYSQILRTPLGPKKYEYSDLGYYFIKRILESQTGSSFETYLSSRIYAPMGLRTLCFMPLNHFPKNKIIPTEDDQVFRKQLVHGYVHDPGAAMLGGVGGHAGIFSNATDLASLMQLFLNKGTYGGVRYISSEVVEEYTRAQFAGNRRGAGFDRPLAGGGGTCDKLASQSSYGHSGFTGTLVWSDPVYELNYVFLSNRVCPDQNNWKIRDMNVRTEIHRVIYEALAAAK
jgi:beta-N-acetylhexosaminidase